VHSVSTPIQIDPAVVERRIFDLARFGAVGETGVARAVYTPEWVAAQDRVAAWCEEAGLSVRRDAVGNVWGRLEGTEPGPAIVTGSHVDSQTPGGRYDGALGVIAGVTALGALAEHCGRPRRSLEVVSLCEEEGSRFPSAGFWGSRAIVGLIPDDLPERVVGYDGTTIAEAMRAVGLDPARIPEAKRDDIAAYVELHIEQGPLLEQAGLPVGIVTGIVGIREYRVEVHGRADHAGARPIDMRLDPMDGAAAMIEGVIGVAKRLGRPAVTTVGQIVVEPNFPNIVPERVVFTIDARHPDPAARLAMYAEQEDLMRRIADERGLGLSTEIFGDLPSHLCDPAIVAALTAAAEAQHVPATAMPSGAAHDAQQIGRLCPIGMVFVQSKDGRSHTPAEFSSVDHCTAGIAVLAEGLRRLAYEA
jgi:allantoate deiminase